ncbi:MAG TPA: phage portal protein, partial [Phycisphaerae bacterium]|nr:phage portal protein [Phycisphaerae bacterium]
MGKRQRKQSKRRRAGNSGPPLQRTNRAAASEPAPVVRMAVAARLPKACGGQVVRSGPPMVRPMIRGGYDAAQTTDDNRRHWANADSLSAAAANSLDVRKRVRERARYEVANNCYLNGMVQTLANDCIGTGPRLQMLTDDAALNDRIEERFSDWAREIHLAA